MPVDPPPSLGVIGARVAARIDRLLADEQHRWAGVDADLDEPIAALRSLVAGGKRLRPAFAHWGFAGAGGDADDPRLVDVGAAIELVHAMALIHDDIMDGSVRRHGRTSVQVDFAAKHADRGWHGDGRRFGDGSAILIGDLAFVYADGLLRGAPPAVVDVFHDLRLEVNIGQYLDLVGTASRNALPDQARTIGVYKSGKYTVERPLHVGAALAGRLDELAKAYSAYGLPVGEAFQLRDDILGAFGDGQRLGKDVGADLRDGKPTLLYALARERARGSDATLLETRVGQPDLSPDEVTEVQRVMVTTGARADVEENIQELLDQGLAALAEAPVTEGAREELRALALFVTGRDF